MSWATAFAIVGSSCVGGVVLIYVLMIVATIYIHRDWERHGK